MNAPVAYNAEAMRKAIEAIDFDRKVIGAGTPRVHAFLKDLEGETLESAFKRLGHLTYQLERETVALNMRLSEAESGARPCCGEYAVCNRPCTPRGKVLQKATDDAYAVALRDALKNSNAALSLLSAYASDLDRSAINTQLAINYGVIAKSPLLVPAARDEQLTVARPSPTVGQVWKHPTRGYVRLWASDAANWYALQCAENGLTLPHATTHVFDERNTEWTLHLPVEVLTVQSGEKP